mmetsp:Transcript_17062/g.37589  ORF Transcript_17062/g.37589 Transcript_17062/m.37589 type:complete len:335 (+) Transcript_17062:1359-2363(+)
MGSVSFLPEELTRADERSGLLELPPNHGGPLIELQGKVTVGPDPLGISGIHDGFRCRANCDRLRHIGVPILGDPGNLRRKTLHVVLLCLQCALGHEQRKIGVLHTELLDLAIEKTLDHFPHEICSRTQNIASRDLVILNKLCSCDHLRVPLRKIVILPFGDPLGVLFTRLHLGLGLSLGFRLGFGFCLRRRLATTCLGLQLQQYGHRSVDLSLGSFCSLQVPHLVPLSLHGRVHGACWLLLPLVLPTCLGLWFRLPLFPARRLHPSLLLQRQQFSDRSVDLGLGSLRCLQAPHFLGLRSDSSIRGRLRSSLGCSLRRRCLGGWLLLPSLSRRRR